MLKINNKKYSFSYKNIYEKNTKLFMALVFILATIFLGIWLYYNADFNKIVWWYIFILMLLKYLYFRVEFDNIF